MKTGIIIIKGISLFSLVFFLLLSIFRVWISPKLPKISESAQESDGIGPTGFKTTLLTYLKHYNLPCLNEWIDHIKKADFSEVK